MIKNQNLILKSNRWDISPDTKLAGIPIFRRTLLTLGKSGVKNVDIFAENYEEQLKNQVISHKFLPKIRFISEITDTSYIIEASGLYEPSKIDPSNLQSLQQALITKIQNKKDLKNAEKYLWESLRKPIENDGIVAYFLGRPISRIISKIIINTSITPNQATLTSLFFALLGAIAVSFPKFFIVGALLYWFSFVFDCVDGELARLRFQGSRFGQWLDTIVDDTATTAFSIGLGILMWKITNHSYWFYVAILSSLLYLFSAAFVYRVLKNMPVVDTAQYPYFFLGTEGSASKDKNFLTLLAYLVRRDVVLFLHFVFAVLNLPIAMISLQLFLNFGMSFITFTDVLVKHFIHNKQSE